MSVVPAGPEQQLAASWTHDYAVDEDAQAVTKTLSRDQHTSQMRKNIFMVAVVLTQLVQVSHFGLGINSGLSIAASIGASPIQASWIAASFPLTQGSFVLVGGRLGSVFGHRNLLAVGCFIWLVFTLSSGFAKSIVVLCALRGLTGIGGGLMVPNAVGLLGITFPPGKQRNLSLALFGAMAPVGAAGGSLVSGVVVQLTAWKWIFFLLTILGTLVFGIALCSIPKDDPVDPHGKIDWTGAYLGIAGLILFNFVWNQAPAVGWGTPYIYALLMVGTAHLAAFAYWEAAFASEPLLPTSIWKAPSFTLLMLTIFCAFMSLGIFLWYTTLFMITIRHDSLIQVGVQFLPLTILGTCAAFLAAWLVSRLPAQVIVGIGSMCLLLCNLLLSLNPRHEVYWAMLFPSLILSAFTADLIFASTQIIASSLVGRAHQGAAGSLIGTLLSYGMSTGLGFAGTVEVHLNRGGTDLLRGYRGAGWLGVGLAAVALLIGTVFVRMPKETRDGWGDDRKDEIKDLAVGLESRVDQE